MADPFTQIPNELLEALARIRIPGEPRQVLDVIFRRTYGFHKKVDAISLSQFCLATGLQRNTICKAIKKLLFINLITKKGTTTSTLYAINKNFETWRPLPKRGLPVPKRVTIVTNMGNKRYPKGDIQNIKEKRNICTEEILNLSNLLADKILINNPKHRYLSNEKREKTVQRWAEAIEELHRIDKQAIEEIRDVIEWCQDDPFWKLNILSAKKLRDQWDQLYLKMKAKKDKEAWRE